MADNSTSSHLQYSNCNDFILGIRVIKTMVLLPLCSFVLLLGLQTWRQQSSFKSHSDLFTFHLAAMELIWVCGFFCVLSEHLPFSKIGFCATLVTFYGEIMFHVLTCVERYLAVVHPVTYLGLKSTRGIRIRGLTIGCVWLLCFGLACMNVGVDSNYDTIPLLCLLVLSIIATSFCSFFVLWVLIRPGPGGGEKDRIDQSKQRSFRTIMFIWSVLCLWFVVLLLQVFLSQSPLQSATAECITKATLNWFNLLSSLVLPMLFLHRVGKQSCCCNKRQ